MSGVETSDEFIGITADFRTALRKSGYEIVGASVVNSESAEGDGGVSLDEAAYARHSELMVRLLAYQGQLENMYSELEANSILQTKDCKAWTQRERHINSATRDLRPRLNLVRSVLAEIPGLVARRSVEFANSYLESTITILKELDRRHHAAI